MAFTSTLGDVYVGSFLFADLAVTRGKSCSSNRHCVCEGDRGKCVVVNQISPGKVDVRDSKAFRIFLLDFSSSLGIN